MTEPVKHGRPNLPFTTEPEKLWLKQEQTDWLTANVGKYKKSQLARDLFDVLINADTLTAQEIVDKIQKLKGELK